jgi:ABC-type uncharacterized transport system permease subunit
MPDWLARVARTLLQMLAGGAFAALFNQIARDVAPQYQPYILLVSVLLVTLAQNAAETAGLIPTILKPAAAAHETARIL